MGIFSSAIDNYPEDVAYDELCYLQECGEPVDPVKLAEIAHREFGRFQDCAELTARFNARISKGLTA